MLGKTTQIYNTLINLQHFFEQYKKLLKEGGWGKRVDVPQHGVGERERERGRERDRETEGEGEREKKRG